MVTSALRASKTPWLVWQTGDLQHRPEAQFTAQVLEKAGARISMDGRRCWMNNVFIERLWRSLKYECIYLNVFETDSELRAGLTWWIDYYDIARRPRLILGTDTERLRPKRQPEPSLSERQIVHQEGPILRP
jgi:transposase InsO family protein